MKNYKFTINDDKYNAKILEYKNDMVLVEVNGTEYKVNIELEKKEKLKLVRSQVSNQEIIPVSTPKIIPQATAGSLVAPIPGLVLKILVEQGDIVKAGQTVTILEAMKMESEISVVNSGKVKNILVKEGENIQEGQVILEIGE